MANSITAYKQYVAELDKIFKAGAKTTMMGENISPMVREGSTAGSFLVPKVSVVGLGDYNKSTGYSQGDITYTWEEKTYTKDRARKFSVDAVDEIESMGAFGAAAGEFLRTQVIPEIDAYRLSTVASASGVTTASGALTDASGTKAALNTAINALVDTNEVPEDNLVLYITPTLARLVRNDSSTAVRTDVLDRATVVEVPQARMVSKITLDAGASGAAGGWAKSASGSVNLNFILMDKTAAFADAKHTVSKVITPEQNQTTDGWMFFYRLFHDAFVWENKANGIYVHKSTS